MRLLITRPEPDASEIAERLRARGHAVLVQPMMRIEFSDEPAVVPAPAAIILTSRNAVRALKLWPRVEAWHALPVFAAGEATAFMARDIGFGDIRVGGGNVAALAELVRADFDRTTGPILYPAARERSADMAGMLASFTVLTVEAYRGVAATALDQRIAMAIKSKTIDGALFFSRRTATIFVDLVDAAGVGEGLRPTTLFALAAAVAEPLATLNAADIVVAERPDEERLLALIPSPS